jgi:hypothetical protein
MSLGGLALALVIVAAFALTSRNPVTEANADEYMVSSSLINGPTTELSSGGIDFNGQILEECSVSSEIEPLFATGTTWEKGGFSSVDGSDNGFHVHQRIYTADVANLERTATLLETAGTDPGCDSSGTGFIDYSFDYENPRSVEDAYGVNVKGSVIDVTMTLCSGGCTTSLSSIVIAYRDNVAMLIEYGGSTDGLVTFRDVDQAVKTTLEKFAG